MKSLTEEEQEVIRNENNLIAIGRSGTGKTLCGLLRILATDTLNNEMNFNHDLEHYSKMIDVRYSNESKRCNLHTIFMTASNILTDEVCKRYVESIKVISESIKDKNKKIIIDKEVIVNTSNERLTNVPETMSKIKEEHFPLFLTARQLLTLIDSTLKEPYSEQNSNKETQKLERMARWGLGVGGNEPHKYNPVIIKVDSKEFKKELCKDIEGVFDDSDNEPEDENEILDKSKIISKIVSKNKSDIIAIKRKKGDITNIEVNYEHFRIHFWNKYYDKKGKKVGISSSMAWKEIFTYIKGSVKSHEYPNYYLPFEEYTNLKKPTSILTKEDEKNVYDIFLTYQAWMDENNHHDILDILNHVLDNIKWGYQGIPIHEIICDEVQDLPPAYFLFLEIITEEKLIFSGDTAQSIVEGVGFRFQDIRYIFYNFPVPIQMPIQKQLSINFRSHTRILDLAASVIRLLELLFPDTIDKLRKEQSEQDGLKLVIINDEDDLARLFTSKSGSVSCVPIQFGFDQAIIVRSKEAKDKLPSFLSSFLIFTIQECKVIFNIKTRD